MDTSHKKILSRHLPKFVAQVNPQQLLTHLPCLSEYSKDEIDTAQNSKSRSYAAQKLHEHLIRRPDGFQQLIAALRHDSVDCTKLADLLDPDHTVDYHNGAVGRQEDNKQNQFRSDQVLYSRQPVSPGVGRQEDSTQNQFRSDQVLYSRQPVSPGAEGWGPSPAKGHIRPSNYRSPSKCDLNTPWKELPAGVTTILKKFDAQQSLKKIDDLADQLYFTIEEMNEIRAEVQQGESLTLALLQRWIHGQSELVTLGVIMKIFYDLEMESILQELEKKTGVRFEGREECDVSPQVDACPQGINGLSHLERNTDVLDRTDHNPNINQPFEKISGTDKRVLDDNYNDGLHRHIPNRACSSNARSGPEVRQIFSELDNRSLLPGLQNDSTNSIEEDKEKKMNNLEKFSGYRKEDILGNCGDDKHKESDFQHDGKIPNDMKSKNMANALSTELPSGQSKDDSGGFQVNRTSPDHEVEKNNLDRSVSNCSSNTENSTYDSMPESCYVNDFNSEEEKRSISHHSSDISNAVKPGNEESTERMLKEDGNIQNSVVEKTEYSKKLAEAHTDEDYSGNPSHATNHIKALEFERKILEPGQNISDIIRQNDSIESRETSISGISASSSSPVAGQRKNNTTKADFKSLENYVDYSLEDEKRNVPDETNYSKELNSIEKKAGKQLPGHEIAFDSAGVETDNDFEENPTESFKFDWDLGGEAVSIDGETGTGDNNYEQPLLADQLLDQQLGRSDHTFHKMNLQHTGMQEMKLTRRGPASPELPGSVSNQVYIDKEADGDIVGGIMSSEKAVTVNTTVCSKPLKLNTASKVPLNNTECGTETLNTAGTVSLNNTECGTETLNTASIVSCDNNGSGTLTVNSETSQTSQTEEVFDETDNDTNEFSLKDSLKSLYNVAKIVYDSSL